MSFSRRPLLGGLFGAALMVSAGTTAFAQTPTPAAGQPTFTKDVAPILQRSCQTCHRPGMMAPMSLLTYQDARPWARSIKAKVSTPRDAALVHRSPRRDPEVQERSVALRQEIDTIVKWVDAGAPQGNPADMPKPLDFGSMDAWHIKPDVVVKMPKPYRLKATGADEFVDVTIDPGFTKDMFVSAIETRPINMGGYKVIHHATTNLIEDEDDPTGAFLNEYAIGKSCRRVPARLRSPGQGRARSSISTST